ncbi:carboxymuconolactone decarboxylase family protein [Bryobacter aggregatus]|uniref:carboxymuconolactone decarboxylase family protein n=1 Tax=Bryobacter aggregatus TaxID=360054 RepID=UPI0004E12D50|nr:carboxymuconolactone decarboxylase family protein [Bryobacter aggregatus]
MSFQQLLDSLPAYAKDMKLNLGSLINQPDLTPVQTWGTLVASAIACRNPEVTEAIFTEAEKYLTPEQMTGAKAAATVMAMNNVYYRFLHLTPNEKYATIPAKLRMNIMRSHGADALDFELWCVAVSAINNCATCVASHEKVLRDKGVREETILASVRLAAVLHSIATVLQAESVEPVS